MARPRLCAPLPVLPAPADVRLTRHAVERYIRRRYGTRTVRWRVAEDELRELCDAGEVQRTRPDGYGSGDRRFERPVDLIGFVVCDGHEPAFVLPVKADGAGFWATTALLPRR